MSVVSLVHGQDRYFNVKTSLELIERELADRIKGKKKILIKPNFVSVYKQLAATHVESVRAVLDVITKYTDEQITIAEGATLGPTKLGFLRYGYYKLKDSYNVRFVNLNRDTPQDIPVFDSHLNPMSIPIARTVLNSDFRISVTPLKTHDTVLVTLSLKNIAVGSICGVWAKKRIHRGYRAINKTLSALAKIIPPHLSVIDGFEGMEGDGPVSGNPVDTKVTLASVDFLAADTVGAHLMGFEIDDIGYLYHCKEAELGQGDLSKIEVRGERLENHVTRFKRHRAYQEQLSWKESQEKRDSLGFGVVDPAGSRRSH